ncbi:hypothetical protein Xentx_02380 [Xenorhabdus thuongxuanensis]|uniref:Uncharacterized protein n=1 Tax=Xenorhabdus thuongxuanensis TaxID=1873484 RepID=A0A1Q5TZ10_9GAMM|nr:hypothetical protein Xentx_02380 [Xenorhabdus thuongxuanensis]
MKITTVGINYLIRASVIRLIMGEKQLQVL